KTNESQYLLSHPAGWDRLIAKYKPYSTLVFDKGSTSKSPGKAAAGIWINAPSATSLGGTAKQGDVGRGADTLEPVSGWACLPTTIGNKLAQNRDPAGRTFHDFFADGLQDRLGQPVKPIRDRLGRDAQVGRIALQNPLHFGVKFSP